MDEKETEELKRQSLLLQALEGSEGFRIWRREVCDPLLEQIDMLLADSDNMSESVIRANVKLKYLLKDAFYRVFDRVKATNDRDKELSNQ